MKLSIITLPLILVLILTACATPPREEMDKAQDAVTKAENDIDAVTYAPNTLVRARESLSRMQNEADAKRYDAAKSFANEAIANAERAITEGKTGANRARDEATNLLNSLATPLVETTTALNAAQNNPRLVYVELANELDTAYSAYEEGRQSLQNSNYPNAISRGQYVRTVLASINSTISEATPLRKQ